MGKLLETLAAVGAIVTLGCAKAGPISGKGTWESTLHGRDDNGYAVSLSDTSAAYYYDSSLDITWLRNIDGDEASWNDAVAWASGLTYFGGGWRLPSLIDSGTTGCEFISLVGDTDCGFNVQTKIGDVVYSEMAHLWYVTLGNKSYYTPGTGVSPQPGWGMYNTAYFQIASKSYWTGTWYASDPAAAWAFSTVNGAQYPASSFVPLKTTAVRNGDVLVTRVQDPEPLPEPATVALVGSALLGIAATRRQKVLTIT